MCKYTKISADTLAHIFVADSFYSFSLNLGIRYKNGEKDLGIPYIIDEKNLGIPTFYGIINDSRDAPR